MSKIKIYKSFKVLILIFLSFQANAEEFVYGLGDVPIFKDMKSIEDSYIIFDKVDGRYLYSEIKGKYKILEIQEYYKKVLPNLGWKFFEKNSFGDFWDKKWCFVKKEESYKLENKKIVLIYSSIFINNNKNYFEQLLLKKFNKNR